MGDDAVAKLAKSLGRYQALVVGGLAFIVTLAITVMAILLFLSFSLGHQAAKLEAVAQETHSSLCALYLKEVVANRENRRLLNESPAGLLDPRGNVIIAADLIQRGIDQRQDTIDALKGAGLSC